MKRVFGFRPIFVPELLAGSITSGLRKLSKKILQGGKIEPKLNLKELRAGRIDRKRN